jgi:riboflavin biosynthesis pyrimidine reductase
MNPFIVCHMMASLDGRIDCDMLETLGENKTYYETLASYECAAFIEGRVSRAKHAALPGTFEDKGGARAGFAIYRAIGTEQTAGWSVALDTKGTLLWKDALVDDKPLLCIVSEATPAAYLDYLKSKGISYIAVGAECIDLARAMELLHEHFCAGRVAVVGGGHINAAFLAAGLLDEISILYGPLIDGRADMASIFDGLPAETPPRKLSLRSVKRFDDGCVWMTCKLV